MNKNLDQKLKIAIKTFGCQMNVYDSQVAEGFLKKVGYEVIGESETGDMGQETRSVTPAPCPTSLAPEYVADVILMNTCSVREHAEDRVYSRLGMLGKIKRTNPNLIVGLMGCMVEEHKEKLFKRFPQLDFMVGTRNISELPSLIEHVTKTREQVARIKQDGISIEYSELINRQEKFHAWLPIMTGCNKICTFCIVPITRGSEVSMPAREVYREASRLVSEGVKWITLLGQNVNSYNGVGDAEREMRFLSHPREGGDLDSRFRGNDIKKGISFSELVDMLCQIEGLERISFTTSHPHDATEELYRVIRRNPKISRRFHLPLQSGSDRTLKRMKRLHTYEEYKAKIDLMRELIPDVSVTTDIITGFSGETDEDHRVTCAALENLRYDSAFIYKYSLRHGTPAAKLEDDVALAVKESRHQELLAIQRRITEENNRARVGKTVTVFAEALNQKDPAQVVGRTDQDKKVLFSGWQEVIGQLVKIQLTDLRYETFIGELVGHKSIGVL